MRLLPKKFVIHKWVVEANKLKLVPIHVSLDGMRMQLARPETVQAYNQMVEEAIKQGIKLKVISAYRSTTAQVQEFAAAVKQHGPKDAILWLAPPGYSEHHTGWAVDIGDEADPKGDDNPLFERTQAFRWLKTNARRFGFELSFPPNNWQGISYEPWHWRYVGTPEAKKTFHPSGIPKLAIWGLSVIEACKNWMKSW